MSDQRNPRLAELREQVQGRERLEGRQAEVREELMKLQLEARTMELHLDAARAARAKLEGFSLGGLLSGLSGNRQERLAETQEACDVFQREYDGCRRKLESLERELGDLGREIERSGDAQEEYRTLLAQKREQLAASGERDPSEIDELDDALAAARNCIADIQRALEAGEEALSDLHDEFSTVGTLGRCTVAEGHAVIGVFMDASRDRTAEQCAGRLRGSVRRFRRRLSEVIQKYGPDSEGHLVELDERLGHAGNNLSSTWFFGGASSENTLGHVAQWLTLATALLEKKLAAVQAEADSVEQRQQAAIENA